MKKSVYNDIIDHSKKELPLEACGILSGKNGRCDTAWPMENIERSPNSFAISNKDLQQAFKSITLQKEAFTGIYHSHPTAAPFPSKEDITHHIYPEVVYFIVSLRRRTPLVRCFQIKEYKVYPLKIITV
nr:M67 family metallopeptidase [Pontibacillus yanchengensis]